LLTKFIRPYTLLIVLKYIGILFTSSNSFFSSPIFSTLIPLLRTKTKCTGVLGVYQNFGVSGYTTDKVLTNIDTDNSDNAISNAEIITLDVGAKSTLGYIPEVLFCPN